MDLSKIISISGKPGLYQILSQSRNGVLAKSLINGKRINIGQTLRVSTLSDISVYVEYGDEPLKNVLKKINELYGDEKLDVDLKDDLELRSFLKEVLPEHDEERVYISDIKKIIKWYNMLYDHKLLDFSDTDDEAEETQESNTASKNE